jgi:hypothetical protein
MRTPSDLSEVERADMLHHCFAKEGVRSVAPIYGLETSGCYRQIIDDVRTVNHFLDVNLRGSELHVGDMIYRLDFGKHWQSDGKLIRVTKTFAKSNPVYRRADYATPTDRTVTLYDIYNENVLEKKHHCILASWYLHNNAPRYIFKALRWAVVRGRV